MAFTQNPEIQRPLPIHICPLTPMQKPTECYNILTKSTITGALQKMATEEGSRPENIQLPSPICTETAELWHSAGLQTSVGKPAPEEAAGDHCCVTLLVLRGIQSQALSLGWTDLLFLAFKSSREKQLRKFCGRWFY